MPLIRRSNSDRYERHMSEKPIDQVLQYNVIEGQGFVTRPRAACANLNHEALVASMIAEAHVRGCEPDDLNAMGLPNIYFRGLYEVTDPDDRSKDVWLSDIFMMSVKKRT